MRLLGLPFLYERLLGAEIPARSCHAFCAAAALPQIRPDGAGTCSSRSRRSSRPGGHRPGWSNPEPSFYPEWVEKEVA